MKTLWLKEEMLTTTIFSFAHNNFMIYDRKHHFSTLNLLSENASNLGKAKILSYGKELNNLNVKAFQHLLYIHLL